MVCARALWWVVLVLMTAGLCGAQGFVSLRDELVRLQERGLPIVWSTSTVTAEMGFPERVIHEPVDGDPMTRFEQVLALVPLMAQPSEDGALVVVPEGQVPAVMRLELVAHPDVPVRPGGCSIRWRGASTGSIPCVYPGRNLLHLLPGAFELTVSVDGFVDLVVPVQARHGSPVVNVHLEPVPEYLEAIDVMPTSDVGWAELGVAAHEASGQAVLQGVSSGFSDPLRRAAKMPGVSSNDGFAEVWIRGGWSDQVMVRLDGHEIYEPYILSGFMSKVSKHVVGESVVFTGAFPVELGNRLGVIDLTSQTPSPGTHLGLTYGFFEARADASRQWSTGKALIGGRVDQLRFSRTALNLDAAPRFADVFVKVERDFGDTRSLRANVLFADDYLEELTGPDDIEAFRRDDRSLDLWATYIRPWGSGWLSSQWGGSSKERRRTAHGCRPGLFYDMEEQRAGERLNAGQLVTNRLQALGHEHHVRWGWDYRQEESTFDIQGAWALTASLAQLRTRESFGNSRELFDVQEKRLSVHVSDTFEPAEGLRLQAGLRVDHTFETDQQLWSPRFLLQGEASRGSWHVGWGRYVQEHRPHEVSALDGELSLADAEVLERRVVGGRLLLPAGWTASGELYSNWISRPRPRFLNLFAPQVGAPELLVDRYLWPSRAHRSEGLDLLLDREAAPWGAWVAISLGRTRDRTDEGWVRSMVDQPWTFRGGIQWRRGSLRLGASVDLREGWPTTRIVFPETTPETGDQPIVGELGGDRLPEYRRLDVEFSRVWPLKWGTFEFSAYIHNVLNYENVVGYSYPGTVDQGPRELEKESEDWGFRVFLLAVHWRF